jgi:hypothetical protein
MILSPEERELLPPDDDVAFYRRHGWYVSKKILPDAVVDEAIRGSERYFASERDATIPITGGYSDWRAGPWRRYPELRHTDRAYWLTCTSENILTRGFPSTTARRSWGRSPTSTAAISGPHQ